ncbi:VOC family protein [Bacillus salitolerans]|uniref:VOC family protein n=1 Tax=Bacillus salitolerans TaxID=1437434 RepID=A0ABW4LXG4_9BACI
MTQPMVSYVKAINTIYLPVSDIVKSTDWYVNNLHLELLNKVNAESTQAQLKICLGQTIFLIKTAEKRNLTFVEVDGHEQCILTLEVTNIKEFHEGLKRNLVDVEDIQDNGECGLSFYVKDPDGNKIDIWGGWGH